LGATGVARKQLKPKQSVKKYDMATLSPTSASLDLGNHADLIELLPIAAYAVRAPDGVIAWFNSRATELWGRAPGIRSAFSIQDEERRHIARELHDSAGIPRKAA